LETSNGGFAQLEFSSGIIALGPSSRLYVLPSGGTGGGGRVSLDLILLSGWLKSEATGVRDLTRVRTPFMAANATDATVVVQSNSAECDIFLETGGPISISDVKGNGETGSSMQGRAGQFFFRSKSAPISVSAKPKVPFLDSVPREFRDTLPSRKDRVSQAPIEARPDHPVLFDEIEPWLKMPAAWRTGLAARFTPRLADSDFRKQIQSHVREFPEWEPILHPKTTSESPQVRN